MKNPTPKTSGTKEVKWLFYSSVGILVIAFVTLIVALAVVANPGTNHKVSSATGYAVGTTIRQGSVTIKINGVTFGGSQPGFIAPAGKHYAVVEMSITNNTDQPINVLPSSDTYLKDSDGLVTYLTPYALINPFHAGALLPGEIVRGQLSFISKSTGPAKLYIDGIWSGGVVPFKVQ